MEVYIYTRTHFVHRAAESSEAVKDSKREGEGGTEEGWREEQEKKIKRMKRTSERGRRTKTRKRKGWRWMEALLVKRRTQGRQCRPQTRDMPMPKPIAHPDACTSKYIVAYIQVSTYVHIQFQVDCERY